MEYVGLMFSTLFPEYLFRGWCKRDGAERCMENLVFTDEPNQLVFIWFYPVKMPACRWALLWEDKDA